MIGPGTFNNSGVANPQWDIPGDFKVAGNSSVKGDLNVTGKLLLKGI